MKQGTVYNSSFTIYVKEWAPGMQTGAYQGINLLTSITEQKRGNTAARALYTLHYMYIQTVPVQESDDVANYY